MVRGATTKLLFRSVIFTAPKWHRLQPVILCFH